MMAAMNNLSKLSTSELDEYFLRRSFEVARRSLSHGNHPFGAVLVDENGTVLIEAENGYMPSRDSTAHGAPTGGPAPGARRSLHRLTGFRQARGCGPGEAVGRDEW